MSVLVKTPTEVTRGLDEEHVELVRSRDLLDLRLRGPVLRGEHLLPVVAGEHARTCRRARQMRVVDWGGVAY